MGTELPVPPQIPWRVGARRATLLGVHTVLRNLASNPALRPEHIDALIAHGDPDVLLELHVQPELTPGQLDALVAAGGRQAFLELIRFGAMPPERIPEDDPLAQLAAFARP